MAQNTRDISVRVELYEHAILTRHSLKQGDTTRLIMEVRRGGEPYDLSGLGLLLNVKREDELVYIQTGGYELDRNTVTWTLESPVVAESGHIELEAVLTAESGEVISSFIFRLNIEPRLIDGDEDIAPDDRNEIIDAAMAAALSVTQAREARDAAARSAENAQESENAAANSAQGAQSSANSAGNSAQAASDSEVKAKASQEAAAQSAESAQNSAESAQAAQKGAESAKSDAESFASGAKLNADRAETAAFAAKSDAESARSAASGANTSAAEARASASSAGNSAQSAAQSAANAAKSEAAASAAKAEAETLRDEAVSNINSVKDSAVTAVENTRDTAVSDVNAARDGAVGEVREAQNAAVEAVGSAGNAEAAKVERAGADAVDGVAAARDAAVSDVNAAADARIDEIQQAGGGTGTDVGAVRFDAAQELTDEQRATARSNIGASSAIVETAQGDGVVTVNDSAAAALHGLRLFGKSTQDGTPSPDAPVPIVSVGDDGAVDVSITETGQTLTHATPNGLPGVPVTSGGNYTDASGQQWACDEVDFGRGVYVQRIVEIVLNEDMGWVDYVYGTRPSARTGSVLRESRSLIRGIFTHSPVHATQVNAQHGLLLGIGNRVIYWIDIMGDLGISTITELKEWIAEQNAAGTPLTVKYALLTPIETPLTDEQLAAYRALQTQYPTTNVTNDEGAGMEVSYVADTKNYIDKKFAELSAAIVNA